MRALRLFDVSQYVYAGVGNKQLDRGIKKVGPTWVARSMPCAGLTLLLNTALPYLRDGGTDIMFCMDSPPAVKRELHGRLFPGLQGYKGNRPPKPSKVASQLVLAEAVFRHIGIPLLRVPTYEADDLIASIVKYYAEDYDKVYIHSRDSDMFYLVNGKVEIAPVMRQGKVITMSNWQDNVMRKYTVKYNMLTVIKMLDGEPGDNIPRVRKEMGDRILSGIPEEDYPKMGDNELLRKYLADITGNDEETMGIFDLIAPRIAPASKVELYEPELNQMLLQAYAIECGCRGYEGMASLGIPSVEDVLDPIIDEYLAID